MAPAPKHLQIQTVKLSGAGEYDFRRPLRRRGCVCSCQRSFRRRPGKVRVEHARSQARRVFVNVTSARRYLLDLAVIPLGGTIFSARPPLDRSGSGQTATILSGNHVLFAVEVTSAKGGIEIACDGAYEFHNCEITPLPDG